MQITLNDETSQLPLRKHKTSKVYKYVSVVPIVKRLGLEWHQNALAAELRPDQMGEQ